MVSGYRLEGKEQNLISGEIKVRYLWEFPKEQRQKQVNKFRQIIEYLK